MVEFELMRYHGSLPQIVEQLEMYHAQATAAIRGLLSQNDFRTLRIASEGSLVPEAFSRGEQLTSEAAQDDSMLAIGYLDGAIRSIEITPQGAIMGLEHFVTFPFMSIQQSTIDAYTRKYPELEHMSAFLVYLHEFSHFVGYALQHKPLLVAQGLPFHVAARLGVHWPEVFAQEGSAASVNTTHKLDLVKLYTNLYFLEENNANAFAGEVLCRMGYPEAPSILGRSYQDESETHFAVKDYGNICGQLQIGDVHLFKNWYSRVPKMPRNFSKNFVRTYRNMALGKVSADRVS